MQYKNEEIILEQNIINNVGSFNYPITFLQSPSAIVSAATNTSTRAWSGEINNTGTTINILSNDENSYSHIWNFYIYIIAIGH